MIGAARLPEIRASKGSGRAGFTLLEALIAVTLGAIVIGLVTSVFIAQGGYYQEVSRRVELQGTVRSVVDLIREDLQGVTVGGVITAQPGQLVVRAPISMGVVCVPGKGPSSSSVFLPSPGGGLVSGRVAWVGVRKGPTNWSYTSATKASWSSAAAAQQECFDQGADTVGASGEYAELAVQGQNPSEGTVVGLFTEVEYGFGPSALRAASTALFWREGDGEPVEFATGLGAGSRFQYRREGQATFQDQVTGGGQIATIEEIRLIVVAERPDPNTGQLSQYEWDVRIPLRNVP